MRTPEGFQFVYHPRYIEEVRSAKEVDLFNLPANNDLMQTRHTLHKDLEWDQYHFNVVGKQLTQSLGTSATLFRKQPSMLRVGLISANSRTRPPCDC